jgi:hypothetical protein
LTRTDDNFIHRFGNTTRQRNCFSAAGGHRCGAPSPSSERPPRVTVSAVSRGLTAPAFRR